MWHRYALGFAPKIFSDAVEGVSEKEQDSPTVMDCTTLTLVDEVQKYNILPEQKG
ncbi:MAG: hypothetical protein V7K48_21920 [Nostoc sp.]|uniref:hypothetical protein n=1 Tax=Nostoc sp. TaxID=1180 RepID=UPI002FF4FE1D